MKAMKAAVIRNPATLDNIRIEEREEPTCGNHDVLMRVHATSLNFHDLTIVSGQLPTQDGRILMSDGAGEVVSVGSGVRDWKPGDRVLSTFCPNWQDGESDEHKLSGIPGDQIDGFGAELVAVPASALTNMPEHFSFAQAATLPCAALTAWRALMVEAKIKSGDKVLVQGTGGVSLFALQFAKAAGAQVIATSSSEEKLEKLRQLGADHVVNYRETPKWGKAVKALTGGRGVDAVVEVGGPETLAESIKACRIGGHISLIGVLTGIAGMVPTMALFQANITLKGISVGSISAQRDMVRAIDQTGIVPVIDSEFELTEIASAFKHQASQKHFEKIVAVY